MPEGKLVSLLRTFSAADVEFIVVGGVAAVLNGAPVQTFDVDLVYSREPENVSRLLAVLESIDATFRLQPERRLRPMASHLLGSGHLNLITGKGPLDLLAFIGEGLTFPDLLPHSSWLDVAEGVRVRVLDLETVIAVKEQLGSQKDLATLPVLRQALKAGRSP